MCDSKLANFVSPHTHVSSFDSASTPEDFALKELEMGTGFVTVTDHGTLEATRTVYDLCHSDKRFAGKLSPILGCLMPGQEIHTIDGIKKVEDIAVGDLVLTHLGRYRPVLSTMTRHYDGDVYTFFQGQRGSRGVTVTAEHPIFIAGQDKTPKWVRADQVRCGKNERRSGGLRYGFNSYMLLPRLSGKNASIDVSSHLVQRGFVVGGGEVQASSGYRWAFPSSIDLTEDVCRFLGLHCAEGWTGRADNGEAGLTFNRSEKEYITFCLDFLKTSFGIEARQYDRAERGSVDIVYCSRPFASLLSSMCGTGAHNKKVPREIMEAPARYRAAFLRGLLEGDGKKGPRNDLKSSSPDLVWSARLLAVDLGIFGTPKKVNSTLGGKTFQHTYISIQTAAKFRRSFWVNAEGGGGGGTWRAAPIRESIASHYSGPVFNFSVEEDNSYVSDFIMHNCEAYVRDDDDPLLAQAGCQKTMRYRNAINNAIVTVKQYDKMSAADKALCMPEYGYWESMKYAHLTMHFMDQEAFFTAVRLLSKADLKAEQHGSERKPLFGWADLEELGSKNVVFGSGCLVGLVGRHMLDRDDWQSSVRYYQRLRSIVKPGNFIVEMFPHTCDRNWDSGVYVKYADGTEEKFPIWKKLRTDGVEQLSAEDLANAFKSNPDGALKKHVRIVATMQNRKMTDLETPKALASVELREGFLLNECSGWHPDGDVQLGVNKFIYQLAKRYNDPILCSDDAHYTTPEEKVVQDVRLMQSGGWRFANTYNRLTSETAGTWFRDRMGIDETEFAGWVDNSKTWAQKFKDFKFTAQKTLPTSFYPSDTVGHTYSLIGKHGRMQNTPAYLSRLKEETSLFHDNGKIDLLPYFMPLEEICDLYTRNGKLAGPGRGSAAGTLLTYLLGITHADPLKHSLSLARFITKTRIQSGKFPDIDQDLCSRDLLVDPDDATKGWLKERFGECVAQISTDTKLKLRSATKDVFRARLGHVPQAINKMCSQFPEAPQGIEDHDFVFGYKNSDGAWTQGAIETDPQLISFAKNFPEEWGVVQKALGLTRGKGRHACAYVVADEPISHHIPMTTIGGVRVTQFTAAAVEAMGLLKVDFLTVNSLNDIAGCIHLVQDRHAPEVDWSSSRRKLAPDEPTPGRRIDGKFVPNLRCVPKDGKFYDVWELPDDQDVYREICEGKTETVFQFHPPSARKWLKYFDFERGNGKKGLSSILDLATFTALDRPGGLDAFVDNGKGGQHNMMVEYAHRLRGGKHNGDPELNAALMQLAPETYGIMCFQETLANVYRTLGGTTAEEADEFRVHISKKQMAKVFKDKEVFERGAVPMLGADVSAKLWTTMESWSRYGFNKSHAVCYSIIAYACQYLKHHYPLEWWSAVLSNAKRNEINEKFWVHCGKLMLLPEIGRSREGYVIENNKIRAPFNLLFGIADKAQEQLTLFRSARTIEELASMKHKWRLEHGTPTTRTKVNKKTGETTQVQSVRLATSALNSRAMTALIVVGALDPLFAPIEIDGQPYPLTLEQKLAAWEAADASTCLALTGKRPTKKKNTVVQALSPLEQYQMKKEILPAVTEDLIPMTSDWLKGREKLVRRGNDMVMTDGATDYPLVSGLMVEEISEADLGCEVVFSAVGYVTGYRTWSWTDKNPAPGGPKTRSAAEIILDVEGTRLTAIRWGNKSNGVVPPPLHEDISRSIVAVCCRRRPGKGVSLDDVLVIQPTPSEEKSTEVED